MYVFSEIENLITWAIGDIFWCRKKHVVAEISLYPNHHQTQFDQTKPDANFSRDLDTSRCNDKKWFANHSTGKYRKSLCYKGPLFYNKYIADIQANFKNKNTSNVPIVSPKYFKNHAKSFMLKIQGRGYIEIWEGQNTPLYQD